ncbi:MAG: tRNA (N6-isopentenyl adenosine(37)-C2)-methylthiotransferase MiaB [Opitutaceae bacterium]|nr:tRNA (N6-isopentenyl adenosine(37)-C2)-methylthiotransferase MiaB [Opitutaceae bacterium]|tara:strand:- start:4658 stop:6046 length:1389 start_codon:yes stop_codon:yes gene_type:complete
MNRVYIKTYGCQMNERDSEAVGAMLRRRGYSLVDHESDADVVLLNTCSVRDQAEQKAIGKTGYLAKRKRTDPGFILGIMGCMAQNRGEELADRLPDLDLLVGTQKFHAVPDHLDNILETQKGLGPQPITIVDLDAEEGSQNTIREHLADKRQVSAFVSIMQGCNMNCAFCIVPKTRGQERARPIGAIVNEIEELADGGTKEVTLLGQIVNSYGRREIPIREGKSPFVQLLERVQDIKGIERIRFTSPHPRGFRQDLIEAYRDLSKLCEYVHLPAQSGSTRMLKLMNRPYSRERYLEIVDSLRNAVPDMYFSTDIIVGFPGEKERDFEETVDLFRTVAYDMAFVFKYSIRSGTPAATMEDQVPQRLKEERNQRLLRLLEKSSLVRNESLVGTTQEILIEGKAKRGNLYRGKTRGFRTCLVPATERLIGELVPVCIHRGTASALYGDIVLGGVDTVEPLLPQTL